MKPLLEDLMIATKGAKDSLDIMYQFLQEGHQAKAEVFAAQAMRFMNEINTILLTDEDYNEPEDL